MADDSSFDVAYDKHMEPPEWCEWCSRAMDGLIECDGTCKTLTEQKVLEILDEAGTEERYNDPLWNDRRN